MYEKKIKKSQCSVGPVSESREPILDAWKDKNKAK